MKFTVSFLLITLFTCSKSNELRADKVVGIQVYDGFSKSNAKVVARELSKFYGIKTLVLSEIKLPKQAFIAIKSPRYRADSIIVIQNRTINDSLDFVLGLTHRDISITKRNTQGEVKVPKWKYCDFGVMGLAYCPGKSAIISSFRLKHVDKKLEVTRLKKVAIHEFGHNLGLPHCLDKHCVMTSAAEKISTIDNEKMELCEKCKKQLKK